MHERNTMHKRPGHLSRCTTARTLLAMAVALLTTVALPACDDGGGGGPVGTWVIDKEATRAAWQAHIKAGGVEEARGWENSQWAEVVETLDITMVLKFDGTIEASMASAISGGKPGLAQGTWKLVGADLFLTIDGDAAIGRFQGNRLVVEEQKGDDPPIVLKRG